MVWGYFNPGGRTLGAGGTAPTVGFRNVYQDPEMIKNRGVKVNCLLTPPFPQDFQEDHD